METSNVLKKSTTISDNWLQNLQVDNFDATVTTNANNAYIQGNYLVSTPWVNYYLSRVILLLSEVEYLRKLAKNDDKLKDILNKFTAHIEVQVDF